MKWGRLPFGVALLVSALFGLSTAIDHVFFLESSLLTRLASAFVLAAGAASVIFRGTPGRFEAVRVLAFAGACLALGSFWGSYAWQIPLLRELPLFSWRISMRPIAGLLADLIFWTFAGVMIWNASRGFHNPSVHTRLSLVLVPVAILVVIALLNPLWYVAVKQSIVGVEGPRMHVPGVHYPYDVLTFGYCVGTIIVIVSSFFGLRLSGRIANQ